MTAPTSLSPLRPAYLYIDDGDDVEPPLEPTEDLAGVPVFTPTMDEFRDFDTYCTRIDGWGMRSGIVKIIPPAEWTDALPRLDGRPKDAGSASRAGACYTSENRLSQVRIKNSIEQRLDSASPGVWRASNVVHPGRVLNARQWAAVCASQNQCGPDMKLMYEQARRGADDADEDGVRTRSGRTKTSGSAKRGRESDPTQAHTPAPSPRDAEDAKQQTPSLDKVAPDGDTVVDTEQQEAPAEVPQAEAASNGLPTPPADISTESDTSNALLEEQQPRRSRRRANADSGIASQANITGDVKDASPNGQRALRRNTRRGASTKSDIAGETATVNDEGEDAGEVQVDDSQPSHTPRKSNGDDKPKLPDRTTQEEWDTFDYATDWCKEGGEGAQESDWNKDTCRAIEKAYWAGLSYGKPPLYGADLPGTLFTPETTSWNVGTLDHLLTRLRRKRELLGVTTPYLYFGMWRATFAWHVEDMDLYSINYIHFGAPKQWYAIRQADRQRFETAMSNAFPGPSRHCPQFLRHKSYVASPKFIHGNGQIKPIKVVQKAQEIVLTYPFGYHCGYNMGYNCAESVNFALDSWLDIGRKAFYCKCTEDSVRMDVDAMLQESAELERLEKMSAEERESYHRELRRKEQRERSKRKRREAAKAEGRAVESSSEEDEAVVKKAKSEMIESAPERPTTKKIVAKDIFPCEFCPSKVKIDLVVLAEGVVSAEHAGPLPVRRAHRLCANFVPETWVAPNPAAAEAGPYSRIPKELVMGKVDKARYTLKCLNCKRDSQLAKRGLKVQCTFGSCTRATHVSCALQMENGWMLDVMTEAKADELEGRKVAPTKAKATKGKKAATAKRRHVPFTHPDAGEASNSPQPDSEVGFSSQPEQTARAYVGEDCVANASVDVGAEEEEEATRYVVLCHNHNPLQRQRELDRKVRTLRACMLSLVPGQTITVRVANGLYETVFTTFQPGPTMYDEGEVVLSDGTRVRSSKVVMDPNAFQAADDKVWYEMEAEANAAGAPHPLSALHPLAAKEEEREQEPQSAEVEMAEKDDVKSLEESNKSPMRQTSSSEGDGKPLSKRAMLKARAEENKPEREARRAMKAIEAEEKEARKAERLAKREAKDAAAAAKKAAREAKEAAEEEAMTPEERAAKTRKLAEKEEKRAQEKAEKAEKVEEQASVQRFPKEDVGEVTAPADLPYKAQDAVEPAEIAAPIEAPDERQDMAEASILAGLCEERLQSSRVEEPKEEHPHADSHQSSTLVPMVPSQAGPAPMFVNKAASPPMVAAQMPTSSPSQLQPKPYYSQQEQQHPHLQYHQQQQQQHEHHLQHHPQQHPSSHFEMRPAHPAYAPHQPYPYQAQQHQKTYRYPNSMRPVEPHQPYAPMSMMPSPPFAMQRLPSMQLQPQYAQASSPTHYHHPTAGQSYENRHNDESGRC